MTKPVIYFIHGALSTRRSFNYITQQLRSDYSEDEYPYEHKNFSYNIRSETGQSIVNRAVDDLKQLRKRNILLVCHSFGGVVGVAAVRKLVELHVLQPKQVSIVTLSSPLGGSTLASALKILKPSSIFLKNIGSYGDFMRKFMSHSLPCRTRSIVTTSGDADWMTEPNDGVVTVESQLFYQHDALAVTSQVKLNHFEVLLADTSVNAIKKELALLNQE